MTVFILLEQKSIVNSKNGKNKKNLTVNGFSRTAPRYYSSSERIKKGTGANTKKGTGANTKFSTGKTPLGKREERTGAGKRDMWD